MYIKYKRFIALSIFVTLIIAPLIYAQNNQVNQENINQTEPEQAKGAPVVLMGETLFFVYDKIGPFSPQDRAKAISDRLSRILRDPLADANNIKIFDRSEITDILIGDIVIMSVTNGDARAVNMPRQVLTEDYANNIKNEIIDIKVRTSAKNILIAVVLSLGVTGIFIFAINLSNRLLKLLYSKIEQWQNTRIHSLKIHDFEIFSVERITSVIKVLARVSYIVLIVIAAYFYVPFILSLFPWTKAFADRLVGYIFSGLDSIWGGFVIYAPYILFVAIVAVVSYYTLKLIRLIFREIEKGSIKPLGFHPEWAQPTYRLIRLVIIIIAIMIIYSYILNLDSQVLKWIFIFLGVLIALGSIPSMSNFIAGIVVMYMGSFKIGDQVKIGDTVGEVIFRSLLVTRIRTDRNVEVTIPNSVVLGSQVSNFSSQIQQGKEIILNTTVTIGYNVSWKKVHEILIESARLTKHILHDPEPFVLQKSLDEFHVSYELNAYTQNPNNMASIYSELHQNIQDKFNEANIEIMTPNFAIVRDDTQSKLPKGD